ncbi:hypothetical protein [Streptomyces lydicus]|uniref:hypothetical protein n=1 Tax=Streptomyces lydicus TaxID=47763 RepID=UPI0037AC4FF7
MLTIDQLSVAYIDTAAELRARRGTAGPEDATLRDTVKASRGASEIATIADTVVDNNGTRLALERQLDGIALEAAWPTVTPATTPVNSLGLPVALERFLTALLERATRQPEPLIDLLAVTGSGACGKYQHGWSSLDVFVIAEPDRTTELRKVLIEVQSDLGEVKLGLTVLSQAECRAGAVTSRLLHVMTLPGTGSLQLAEVLEVVHTLAADLGIGPAALQSLRRSTTEARGAFDARMIWTGRYASSQDVSQP